MFMELVGFWEEGKRSSASCWTQTDSCCQIGTTVLIVLFIIHHRGKYVVGGLMAEYHHAGADRFGTYERHIAGILHGIWVD